MKEKCLQYLKDHKQILKDSPQRLFMLNNIFKYFEEYENDIVSVFDALDDIFKNIDLSSIINTSVIPYYKQKKSDLYSMRVPFKNSIGTIDHVLYGVPYFDYFDINGKKISIRAELEERGLEGIVEKTWAYLDLEDTLDLVLCVELEEWGNVYFNIEKDTKIFEEIIQYMIYIPNNGIFFNQKEIESLIIKWGSSL